MKRSLRRKFLLISLKTIIVGLGSLYFSTSKRKVIVTKIKLNELSPKDFRKLKNRWGSLGFIKSTDEEFCNKGNMLIKNYYDQSFYVVERHFLDNKSLENWLDRFNANKNLVHDFEKMGLGVVDLSVV